jgi:maleylpyruvate isomerase
MAGSADASDTARTVASLVDALIASTKSLFTSISDLTDAQVRERSLLPGWTRAHVLSHLARNADATVNLVTWARTGVETPMYQSREQRAADIEAGARRSAAELVEDVHRSHEQLLHEIDVTPDSAWTHRVRWGLREREGDALNIPHVRRVEVEIHHVDLDLDYTLAHLPEDFVERLLGEVTSEYSQDPDKPGMVLVGNDDEGRWTIEPGGQEVTGPPPALLGWLLGRTNGLGIHSDAPLPQMGAWR